MRHPSDQPAPVRTHEQLDVARLQAYLGQTLPVKPDEIDVMQFPSGYSNLTYSIRFDDCDYVLRRPPFGNQVKSAHDMGREFRVLQQLCRVYPPAPCPILYCEDESVLGAPFYLMERRQGVILRGPEPPQEMADDPQLAQRVSSSLIDNLVSLHAIDYRAAGLEQLGKPEGYVQRQVTGWIKRYEQARTDQVVALDELGRWLAAHPLPDETASLIHNDYKYDNVMLHPRNLSDIVAVLDWEMATLGDPRLDLGTTLAYWIEPEDPELLRKRAFGPTMVPGTLKRAEVLQRYITQSGRQVDDPLFYYCYGVYKLAVIVQQIYARYVRGHTQDPRFSELHHTVAALGDLAAAAISRGSL